SIAPATAGTDQLTFRFRVLRFPFLVDWYQEIDYSVDSCSPVPERLDQVLLVDLEDVRQGHSGMQGSVPLRGASCFDYEPLLKHACHQRFRLSLRKVDLFRQLFEREV